MEKQVKVLILTDHSIHSPMESIYAIAKAMAGHPAVEAVHCVSRSTPGNRAFFQTPSPDPVWAAQVTPAFVHSPEGKSFSEGLFQTSVTGYDAVMLRLPRANSMDFFQQIESLIPTRKIINQPQGIIETGDKRYLLHFPQFCPPMQLCQSVEEVLEFAKQFPIVLKPFNNSGGRGIVKIDGDQVFVGNVAHDLEAYMPELEKSMEEGMLAMQFLKNVSKGDKRVIVVNGKIVAAALRIPAEGSWLANVSQGGSSVMSEPDADEIAIAEGIIPNLLTKGVVLFGFDTLVDDSGKRILSELNTSCVNGIYPAELHSGKPIVKTTADLLVDYIQQRILSSH